MPSNRGRTATQDWRWRGRFDSKVPSERLLPVVAEGGGGHAVQLQQRDVKVAVRLHRREILAHRIADMPIGRDESTESARQQNRNIIVIVAIAVGDFTRD